MRAGIAAVALLAAASSASAITFTNGGFEATLVDQSSEFGSLYPVQQVTGWTTNGYNWVFRPGEADGPGGPGQYGNL